MHSVVAIVGRPNVGKSTLFNRMLGKTSAIVGNAPGVTRDRHYEDVVLRGRLLTLVDTGGFDPQDEDPLRQGIARGVQAAIDEARVVVCVLDALHPPTEADRHAVEMLRRAGARVVYFANRADNARLEHVATDLYRLGLDHLIVGSALHGRNVSELEAAIVGELPELTPDERGRVDALEADDEGEGESESDGATSEPNRPRRPLKLALLGRPNAGKSSLLNLLSGSERSLVDHRPGTTRDPIEATVGYKGRSYQVIDTAGVRRKAKVRDEVEVASVMRAINAMSEAETVVLLCDASQGLAEQDAKLLSLATDRGVPVIVGLNKIDLLTASEKKEARQRAMDALHFAPFAPIVELSVKHGRGISKLMSTVDRVHAEFEKRVTTAELNRFVQEVVERTPPPSQRGRIPRIYYLTQVHRAPPLFVAMCSSPKAFPESYRRFLQNRLQETFGMSMVPVRLRFRARRRRERSDSSPAD